MSYFFCAFSCIFLWCFWLGLLVLCLSARALFACALLFCLCCLLVRLCLTSVFVRSVLVAYLVCLPLCARRRLLVRACFAIVQIDALLAPLGHGGSFAAQDREHHQARRGDGKARTRAGGGLGRQVSSQATIFMSAVLSHCNNV